MINDTLHKDITKERLWKLILVIPQINDTHLAFTLPSEKNRVLRTSWNADSISVAFLPNGELDPNLEGRLWLLSSPPVIEGRRKTMVPTILDDGVITFTSSLPVPIDKARKPNGWVRRWSRSDTFLHRRHLLDWCGYFWSLVHTNDPNGVTAFW